MKRSIHQYAGIFLVLIAGGYDPSGFQDGIRILPATIPATDMDPAPVLSDNAAAFILIRATQRAPEIPPGHGRRIVQRIAQRLLDHRAPSALQQIPDFDVLDQDIPDAGISDQFIGHKLLAGNMLVR